METHVRQYLSKQSGQPTSRRAGAITVLLCLFLLLSEVSGCVFIEPSLLSDSIRLRIDLGGGSPWEAACDTYLWYVVRWHDEKGERKELYVPAGVRHCDILVGKGIVVGVTAVPLGTLLPIGGVYVPGIAGSDEETALPIVLRLSAQGAAAAELIQSVAALMPEQVLEVNGVKLVADMVREGAGDTWSVETGEGWWDLVSGRVTEDSFFPKERFSLMFVGLPVGTWVSENPMRPDIVVQSSGRVTLSGFYEGDFRYLHRQSGQILTIYALRPREGHGIGEAIWRLMDMPIDLEGSQG